MHPIQMLPPANQKRLVSILREVVNDPATAHLYAARQIVKARGIEPREGFKANNLSVELGNGVEVSIEGRARRNGIAIVRWQGEVVLHECDAMGRATYAPGDWEDEIVAAARELESPTLPASIRRTIEHGRAKQNGGFVVQKIAA